MSKVTIVKVMIIKAIGKYFWTFSFWFCLILFLSFIFPSSKRMSKNLPVNLYKINGARKTQIKEIIYTEETIDRYTRSPKSVITPIKLE